MNNKTLYLARRAEGISREDWPRAWKSHAIFASQFPVTGARIDWMRYCNRVETPTLDGEPVDLPMLSTAHDGVANLNNGQKETSLSPVAPEIREQLDADELRVFDDNVRHFVFPSKETAVLEGLPGKAALYVFLPLAAQMNREEFKTRLDGAHADIARQTTGNVAGLKRYAHNHVQGDLPPRYPFAAIVEMWFDTQDNAVRALSEGALDAIFADLRTVTDMDKSVTILTTPCHAWPKDEVLQAQQDEATA